MFSAALLAAALGALPLDPFVQPWVDPATYSVEDFHLEALDSMSVGAHFELDGDVGYMPSTRLTLNGTAMTLAACYNGTDAGASTWTPCGGITGDGTTLDAQDDGANFTTGAWHPVNAAGASAVEFNAGDYYWSSEAGFADVTTQDLVVELVAAPFKAADTGCFYAKGVLGDFGHRVCGDSTNVIMEIANAASVVSTAPAGGVGQWAHFLWIVDRNLNSTNGFKAYKNGASVDSDNPVAAAGTITTTSEFSIGAENIAGVGTTNLDGRLLALRIWTCAGCLDNSDLTEENALALSRAASVMGLATVTGVAPTTMARAQAAMTAKRTGTFTKLYPVAANWLRQSYFSAGTGIYVESDSLAAGVGNMLLQSQDFATTWTKIAGTETIDADAQADPVDDGADLGDNITCAPGDGEHACGVTQTTAAITAATWTQSVYAFEGEDAWVLLTADVGGGAVEASAYFNVATCTAGTQSGASKIETFTEALSSGGWCRIGQSFTGTAAAWTFTIQPAGADGDPTRDHTGDTAEDVGIFGAQLELYPVWTSYKPTTTAEFTTVGDDIAWPISGFSAAYGSVVATVATQSFTDPGISAILWHLGDTTDFVELYDTNRQGWKVEIYSGGVSTASADSAALADDEMNGASWDISGQWHGARLWYTANAQTGAVATSVTTPSTNPATLRIGLAGGTNSPDFAFLQRLRVIQRYRVMR